MNKSVRVRTRSWIVLSVNLIIVAAVIVLFFTYMNDHSQKLYNQNLNDIQNINKASAQIASELSASHERKLGNIVRYLSRHTLSTEELLTYIDDINADESITFQLIGADYTGYVIKREADNTFPTISYNNKDYLTIQRIADSSLNRVSSVPYTVEFTDPYSGSRSFARYVYISALDEGELKSYTLLAVYRSSDFFEHININGGFDNMSTVMINSDGTYALRNYEFKSDNFFKYLYVYNNLSVTQMDEIKSRVISGDDGVLRYRNGANATAFLFAVMFREPTVTA